MGDAAEQLPVEQPETPPETPSKAVFLVGGPMAGTAVEAPIDAALIRVGAEDDESDNRYYIAPFEYAEGLSIHFGIHMSLNMPQAMTELWHGYVLKIQLDNFDASQLTD